MAVGHAGPLAPGGARPARRPARAAAQRAQARPAGPAPAHGRSAPPARGRAGRGAAHAGRGWRPGARGLGAARHRPVVAAAALLVVLALLAAAPPRCAATSRPGRRSPDPGYWRTAAAWLDAHPSGRTLLAPATAFGDYRWGHTNDEPLVAWPRPRWRCATRCRSAPRRHPAARRRRSTSWRPAGPSAALAAGAGRGRHRPGAAARRRRPARHRRPGRRRPRHPGAGRPGCAGWPGSARGSPATDGLVGDLSVPSPARRVLEVWAVDGRAAGVQPSRCAACAGSPAAPSRAGSGRRRLAGVADRPRRRRLPGTPAAGPVTDTLRRRRLDFGRHPGRRTARPCARRTTFAAAARRATCCPRRAARPDGRALRGGRGRHRVVQRGRPHPAWLAGAGTRPAAALDGDGRTAWVSSDVARPRWLQVRWPRPHRLGPLEVVASQRPGLAAPTAVRVVTDHGSARATRATDGRLVVTPPAGADPPGPADPHRRRPAAAPMTVTEVVGLTVPRAWPCPRDRAGRRGHRPGCCAGRRPGGCLDVGPAWTCSPPWCARGGRPDLAADPAGRPRRPGRRARHRRARCLGRTSTRPWTGRSASRPPAPAPPSRTRRPGRGPPSTATRPRPGSPPRRTRTDAHRHAAGRR